MVVLGLLWVGAQIGVVLELFLVVTPLGVVVEVVWIEPPPLGVVYQHQVVKDRLGLGLGADRIFSPFPSNLKQKHNIACIDSIFHLEGDLICNLKITCHILYN